MSAIVEPSSADLEAAALPRFPTAVPAFAHIKGELGVPFFGNTIEFLRDAGGLVDRVGAVHGPDFKVRLFGYPVFMAGAPESVKTVLMDRERNFSSRMGWDLAIGGLFPRGLMLRDFDEHRLHRRIMQIAFRSEALRSYTSVMNPLIEHGIRRWDGQRTLKFYPAIKQLMLDIATQVFMGMPLGEEADRVGRAFVDLVQASVALVRVEIPGLGLRRGMNGRRYMARFMAEHIPGRRQGDGRDMFSEFCKATTEEGERYTDQEIVDHMIFLLMAAHDTTTSALTSLMYHLAQDQDWQERLREECRLLDGSAMSYDEADRLKGIEWAFKEAIRMHPPAPFIGRRGMRACQVGGIELPPNAAINVCALVTHFLEEYWTEPRRFDPERFSPARAEDKRHSHCYLPFGSGAHTCIGMHFAQIQVKAFLCQFLPRYRVRLEPGTRITMIPLPIPRPKEGLAVRLERLG